MVFDRPGRAGVSDEFANEFPGVTAGDFDGVISVGGGEGSSVGGEGEGYGGDGVVALGIVDVVSVVGAVGRVIGGRTGGESPRVDESVSLSREIVRVPAAGRMATLLVLLSSLQFALFALQTSKQRLSRRRRRRRRSFFRLGWGVLPPPGAGGPAGGRVGTDGGRAGGQNGSGGGSAQVAQVRGPEAHGGAVLGEGAYFGRDGFRDGADGVGVFGSDAGGVGIGSEARSRRLRGVGADVGRGMSVRRAQVGGRIRWQKRWRGGQTARRMRRAGLRRVRRVESRRSRRRGKGIWRNGPLCFVGGFRLVA